MPLWTGKTLNKVQIGEMIARGGMAEVYFGEHTTLKRKVAVKIMRDHVDGDPETRMRFEREARVVAGLRHPNIIQMYDYDLVEGQPCLIMELVDGTSLGSYLKALHKKEEKLSMRMIAHILSALASAIDYAHSQNIIHRDIKPANVLLRSASGYVNVDEPLPEDVEPVLTDFGLVRLLDTSIQTSTGTVSGTPAYMSPEQARGDKVGRKTDIYSLGVLLYEMLAGTVPFEAESSFGILMKHLNEPPPPIQGISKDLQAVINRALSKDAALRYDSAKELADEFTAVFNGQTVSIKTLNSTAAPISKPETKTKPAFPRIWIGVGVLAVIGLAFFIFWPGRQDINQPVGRVAFTDFNAVMDRTTIILSSVPKPKSGTHYEAWYLAEGGERRRNVGSITMNDNGDGQLVFNHPEQENILALFDQLEVTVESDNDPNPNESSGDVVASSVFPPQALIHVRHLLVSFHGAPNGEALIQGLWYTADEIDNSVIALNQALKDNNEELFRLKTEEIINQLVGSGNAAQYRDWNEDGQIADLSDGYGLLANGPDNGLGYIPTAISHAQFAAQAADATETIQLHSGHVVICIENMRGWSEQILEKALQLQEMSFGSEMEPLAAEMQTLSEQVLFGIDTDGNELIEPILGEGGGDTAYEHAYYMAEMSLL
ncbi:MAG: protein kinase, partial [Anaerolineales bacterium]|nr:protein kinase [Anaerolineales bacterium]